MSQDEGELEGVVAETPYGDVIVTPCKHPEAPGEQWDLPTAMWCKLHQRTIYYCHDLAVLWCDGGYPEFRFHAFSLRAEPHTTLEP